MKTKKQISIQILAEMIEAIDKATDQSVQFKKATATRRAEYVDRLSKLTR